MRSNLEGLMASNKRNDVLVLGVLIQGIPNYAQAISAELCRSEDWTVDLRWAALGSAALPGDIAESIVIQTTKRIPKFQLLNKLLKGVDLGRYRFVVVVDDDVELAERFLDRFLALQQRYQLALAQPARTHDSFIDHFFVAQLLGVEARRTRFVEIGPVFSVAADAFSKLLPFDEAAPMGWGLDFVWPVQLEESGLDMGIIDRVPVRHALRKPVTQYDYDDTNDAMNDFLQAHQYLKRGEAFATLESYPISPQPS